MAHWIDMLTTAAIVRRYEAIRDRPYRRQESGLYLAEMRRRARREGSADDPDGGVSYVWPEGSDEPERREIAPAILRAKARVVRDRLDRERGLINWRTTTKSARRPLVSRAE